MAGYGRWRIKLSDLGHAILVNHFPLIAEGEVENQEELEDMALALPPTVVPPEVK